MALIPSILKGTGALAILTGVMDALVGTKMLEGVAGQPFPVDRLVDAVADSQIRFLGSTWAGFGAMLWWASNDIHARRMPLSILGGAFVLGGIGRSLSVLVHRKTTPLLTGFIAIEFLGPLGIWLSLRGTDLS